MLLVPVPKFRKFSELMYELWHILDNDFGILISSKNDNNKVSYLFHFFDFLTFLHLRAFKCKLVTKDGVKEHSDNYVFVSKFKL